MGGANADDTREVLDGGITLRPGSVFGRYEIVRCIGVGGMGSVFEATHTLLKKRVALKMLHANLGASRDARMRFVREAETVARVSHPNVVDISDVGVEQGTPYLVMEFLEGENLGRALTRGGTMQSRAAVDILVPLAAGLAAVHSQGIVHRDIKPENVLLARGARGEVVPKLVDFGISKHLEASGTGAGAGPMHTVTGTPHYMSPEQARGSRDLDGRTDQYALGILCYQMLTNELPYDSTSLFELMQKIDRGEFRPIRAVRADVSSELQDIIHRAMARSVADRFPCTEAFGRALLPFASDRIRVLYEHDFAVDHPSAVIPQGDIASATTARFTDSQVGTTPAPNTISGVRSAGRPGVSGVSRDAPTQDFGGTLIDAEADLRAKSRRRTMTLAAVGVLALGLAAGGLLLANRGRSVEAAAPAAAAATPSSSFHLTLGVSPPGATVTLDGASIGAAPVDRAFERDGREHVLRVSSPGYAPRSVVFRDAPPTEAFIELERLPEAPAPAVTPVPTASDSVDPGSATSMHRIRHSPSSGMQPIAPQEAAPRAPDIHFAR